MANQSPYITGWPELMRARWAARPRFPVGALGRGTLFTTAGLVSRAVLQAGYLVVVSRWLGNSGYGLFSGSVAWAILFAPLAAAGMGFVFTERLTHHRESTRRLWQRVASRTLLSGVVIALLVLAFAVVAMPVRLGIIDMALLVVAELVSLPLVHTATAALMAQRRPKLASIAANSVPAARLVAVSVPVLIGLPGSVSALVVSHCLGTVVAAVWVMLVVGRIASTETVGRESVHAAPDRSSLFREGAPYAFGALASTSYAEVDKVLLLQLLGAGVAGSYTAAYRVVSVLLLPVNALLSNALPRLFAARRAGNFAQVLRAVVFAACGYSLAGGLAALILAPFAPYVLGEGFTHSSHYMMLLAAWLPPAALHLTGAHALLSSGRKTARMLIEGAGLLLVMGLNLWWLPRRGADGAVLALICAEVVMALMCWSVYRCTEPSRRIDLPAR